MNNEIISIETAQKLRDYELLKKFIKKQIEKERYISLSENLQEFIEMLEEKEKENE